MFGWECVEKALEVTELISRRRYSCEISSLSSRQLVSICEDEQRADPMGQLEYRMDNASWRTFVLYRNFSGSYLQKERGFQNLEQRQVFVLNMESR